MEIIILKLCVKYWKFRLAICRFKRKYVNVETYVIDKIIAFNNRIIDKLENL